MLPFCYLPSLFLNIPQSCLVTSNIIRNYQPLYSTSLFCPSLALKLLYLQLYLSNHLGPSQATNKEQQIVLGYKNILRNHSDMQITFKNEMVYDNPLPYSLSLSLSLYIYMCVCVCIYIYYVNNLLLSSFS